MNCETDRYRNSRFNAVKHGGYSTAFLSLDKEERNQIIDRLNRGKKRLHEVDFKKLNDLNVVWKINKMRDKKFFSSPKLEFKN